MIRKCLSIPQKVYNKIKRLKTRGWREIFSRLSVFYRLYRTADTKTC
jgi:hypothetical protein